MNHDSYSASKLVVLKRKNPIDWPTSNRIDSRYVVLFSADPVLDAVRTE